MTKLLSVEDYSGGFRAADGTVAPTLHGISYALQPGRMTAVVGGPAAASRWWRWWARADRASRPSPAASSA